VIGISDLVAILRTEYARRDGVGEDVLRRNGVLSAEVAAVELRSRGYKVEVVDLRGGAGAEAPGHAFGGREGTFSRSAVALRTSPGARNAGHL